MSRWTSSPPSPAETLTSPSSTCSRLPAAVPSPFPPPPLVPTQSTPSMPSALPLVHAAPPPSPPSLPSPSSPTPAPPSIFTPANHLVPRPSPPPTLFQGFPLKPTPSAPSPQPPAPLSTSRLFSTAVHSPCWLSRLAPASSPSAPVDLYADCKYTASGVAVSDPLTPTGLSLAVLPVPYGLGISNWGSILSASSVNTSVAVFTGASATSVPKAPHLPQSADLSESAGICAC